MLKEADPIISAFQDAVREFCRYEAITQYIQDSGIEDAVHLLAIGKAACGMAETALNALSGMEVDGFVLTKHGIANGLLCPLTVLEAGHPIPDADSIRHTKRILEWLQSLEPGGNLLVLISGGGSALFEYPVDGVGVQRLQAVHTSLVKGGQDIRAMNRERTLLSSVKGGKTLDHTGCKTVHVLMLSDVPDHDPHVIASGPFTPPNLPTGKGYDSQQVIHHQGICVSLQVIGANSDLAALICASLEQAGIMAQLGPLDYFGLISEFPDRIRGLIISHKHIVGPFTRVMGGEMPVRIDGNGKGGRCTHLALLLTETLSAYPGWRIYCLATDGNDFLPNITGGYCTAETLKELRANGVDHIQALQACDSFTALNSIGNIIPSRGAITNVNDIYILAKGL